MSKNHIDMYDQVKAAADAYRMTGRNQGILHKALELSGMRPFTRQKHLDNPILKVGTTIWKNNNKVIANKLVNLVHSLPDSQSLAESE